jgi:Arc/MetJ-type ribon-helix-helix transcriptional regulator
LKVEIAKRHEIKKGKMVLLTVRLPEEDYKTLAQYVREGRFVNVTEALRTAVKLLIWCEGGVTGLAPRGAREAVEEERGGAVENPAVADPAGG